MKPPILVLGAEQTLPQNIQKLYWYDIPVAIQDGNTFADHRYVKATLQGNDPSVVMEVEGIVMSLHSGNSLLRIAFFEDIGYLYSCHIISLQPMYCESYT